MNSDLYDWVARFNSEGLSYGLRLELVDLLKPHVRLSPPFTLSEPVYHATPIVEDSTRVRDIVDWEIVLGAEDVRDVLGALKEHPQWIAALPELLPSFTSLLLETLDLMRHLEGADERSDGSYWAQPSIAEHPQNQKFRDWTYLIEVTRDAFLSTAQSNAEGARAEVERWLGYQYPIFRRLAFFAATATDLFAPDHALQWLLSDRSWWLWSVETEREAIRLLAKLAATLSAPDEALLLSAIVQGPPSDMFKVSDDAEGLRRVVDREIWLRLSKFGAASSKGLSGAAADAQARISRKFPDWRLEPDEKDEFPVWSGDSEEWYKRQNSPRDFSELTEWLLIDRDGRSNDDWSDRCRDDFSVAISALIHLGRRGSWPVQRWRTALQVWSDQSLVLQSWNELKNLFASASNDDIQAIASSLSWWLEAVGKVLVDGEAQFFELLHRVLDTQIQEPFDGGDDPIFKAINSPIGHVTDAAFRWWYRQGLEDGQGLKEELERICSRLANTEITSFRYGRIILAANLVALFRVDSKWTRGQLLRCFDWDVDRDEAIAVWCGFLWAPRILVPLLESIKRQFLDTAKHYDDLGQQGRQYANFLTFIALEAPEPFLRRELALATSQLPPDGLARCASSLVQALDGAGEKRTEYWRNRIRPYLKDVWPKSAEAISRPIVNSFVRLCMKADDAFPDAVSDLRPWLSSVSQDRISLHGFAETHLARRFPEHALAFLDAVARPNSFLQVGDLATCLNDILEGRPDLESDPRFEHLTRLAQQL
jgi:hypothetical protein